MMDGVGCRSLQRQVTVMSMNLNAKLDELQTRGDRQLETDIALCEIRSQLDCLTKSMESCQSDVMEVKRDIAVMKSEVDQVQQIRVEIEELREYVDRLEEQTHRRKLRLLQQVKSMQCFSLAVCLQLAVVCIFDFIRFSSLKCDFAWMYASHVCSSHL